jgi:hypothetical protein
VQAGVGSSSKLFLYTRMRITFELLPTLPYTPTPIIFPAGTRLAGGSFPPSPPSAGGPIAERAAMSSIENVVDVLTGAN